VQYWRLTSILKINIFFSYYVEGKVSVHVIKGWGEWSISSSGRLTPGIEHPVRTVRHKIGHNMALDQLQKEKSLASVDNRATIRCLYVEI
jgi:hypothetical protein